jgi:hypothetical protein
MKQKKKSFGQSTLEFALTLPAMLLFIFGIMDLGRFVYYNSTLQNSVREATRYAVVQRDFKAPTLADIAQEAEDHAIGIKPDDLDVYVNYNDDDSITVYAEYTFFPVTPLGVLILGSSDGIVMYAQATMDVEFIEY